jgi:hypothetical protein
LKIDRTTQEELSIVEDATEYTGKYMNSTLRALEEANKPFGGLGKGKMFFGLVGESILHSGNFAVVDGGLGGQGLYGLLQGGT